MATELYYFHYFKVSEFFTKCSELEIAQCVRGGYINNCFLMLHHLDSIREIYGFPIRITSGYRDCHHNRLVGGSLSSQHKVGLAVDFQPLDGDLRPLLFAVLEYNRRIGCIGQLLVGSTYLHIGLLGDTPNTNYFSIKFYDDALALYNDTYELLKSNNYPVK